MWCMMQITITSTPTLYRNYRKYYLKACVRSRRKGQDGMLMYIMKITSTYTQYDEYTAANSTPCNIVYIAVNNDITSIYNQYIGVILIPLDKSTNVCYTTIVSITDTPYKLINNHMNNIIIKLLISSVGLFLFVGIVSAVVESSQGTPSYYTPTVTPYTKDATTSSYSSKAQSAGLSQRQYNQLYKDTMRHFGHR